MVCFVCIFSFLCNLHNLFCLIYLFLFLCDLYNEIEFTRYVFYIYISYSVSNIIFSFLLQSTICVNYSKLTLQSRNYQTAFLLFYFSFGITFFYFSEYTTGTGFTLANPMLYPFEIKSLFLFVCNNKADNKRKTAAKKWPEIRSIIHLYMFYFISLIISEY